MGVGIVVGWGDIDGAGLAVTMGPSLDAGGRMLYSVEVVAVIFVIMLIQ